MFYYILSAVAKLLMVKWTLKHVSNDLSTPVTTNQNRNPNPSRHRRTVAGSVTVYGTDNEIDGINRLIERCWPYIAEHIRRGNLPEQPLSMLSVLFEAPGIREEYFRPHEKVLAFYDQKNKSIYLWEKSTEYDFYHELSHYLDDIAGVSITRHTKADVFARKYGVPRVKISKPNPSTEIYFYSERTEAEFKQYPNLVNFVITTIKSVGKKNNVVIPHIQFCSVEELGKYSEEPALLWLEDPGIGISTMIIDWWKTDKKTTEQALAFILAHEVGHYVYHFVFSDEQRNKYIAKYGIYSADEAHADKIAEEYSGLERSEAEGAIEHIFDQMGDEK